MSDIIDLGAERNRRAQPDAEFVSRDDYGRAMYHFGLAYEQGGKVYGGIHVWAYDHADAEARVAAMRESLILLGQTFAMVPA